MYTACNNFIKQNKRIMQLFGTFVFGLSLGIAIVTFLCLFNVIDLNLKQYVYIDMEKVIESVNRSLTKQVEAKKISEDEISAKLMLAKNKFNLLLKGYVQQHNAIVFSSHKVIAGANEMTEYFAQETLEGLK